MTARERGRLAETAARRRRNWAIAVLAGLLLLSLGLGLAFEGAESSARQALIDQALRSNEAMVRLASAAVSDKLEDAVRRLTEAASDPALRQLLVQTTGTDGVSLRGSLRASLQKHLDQVHMREQPRFQSWALSDRNAWVWARSPYDPVVVGQNYRYREWFNGQVELPREAKVQAAPRTTTGFSLAFTSTAQDRPLLIGLAAPVFSAGPDDQGRRILGVLNAGIHLDAFNGWLQIAERRPADGGCPERFVLVLHRTQLIRHPCPGQRARPLPIDEFSAERAVADLLQTANRKTSNFRDPIRSTGAGSAPQALAVAAALEKLPDWTLLLEQDVEVALQPMTALTTDFHGPAQLAFALGIVAFLALAALVWWGARTRPRDNGPLAG